MEIATQLTDEQAQKLAFIQQKIRQNTDEILVVALEYYYQQILNNSSNNHLENFSKLGFIGCIEAEPNLAENCESILIQEIGAKE